MRRWLYLLFAVLCFSIIGLMRKGSLDWPSPLLAFFRLSGATFLFGIFVLHRKLKWPASRRLWAEWALAGLLLALAFTLYLQSFYKAFVSSVAVVGFIDPLLVMLLSGLLLSEKVSRSSLVSAALAAAGLLVLAGPWLQPDISTAGLLLAAGSMVCGALFTIVVRRTQHEGPLTQALFYPFAFGAAFLFIYNAAMLFFDGGWADAQAMQALAAAGFPGWTAVAGMVGATALSYWAYETLMQRWGAHHTDLAVRVGISACSAVLGVMVLGEQLTGGWWVSVALLLGSALVLYFESVHRRLPFQLRPHGHTQ